MSPDRAPHVCYQSFSVLFLDQWLLLSEIHRQIDWSVPVLEPGWNVTVEEVGRAKEEDVEVVLTAASERTVV